MPSSVTSGAAPTGAVRPALLGGAPAAPAALPIVRPLFPPLDSFSAEFETALQTGQVTNNGRHVSAFEDALSDYLGVPVAVCNNGETAMLLLLAARGEAGREAPADVICPSYTFAGTPHAIAWTGNRPRFAEMDDRFCLDPVATEAAVGNRTRGILAVDSYGIPCDEAGLADVAERHGLDLHIDSAAAFGARVDGRLTGGFGDGQIFSFHATKPFTTMEGGCVSARDAGLIETVRELRNFGQSADGNCRAPGLNAKMLEVCALVGLRQLPLLEGHLAVRRAAADSLRTRLAALPGLELPAIPEGVGPTWSLLPVVVDEARFGLDRDELARALEAERILVRKYFSPACHRMDAYRALPRAELARTERTADSVIALPLYNDMRPEECDWIVTAFERLFEHAPAVRAALRP